MAARDCSAPIVTPAGPLRILHLITRLPVGGAERLVVEICTHLDRASFKPMVCCIQERGPLAAELERHAIPVLCLGRMQTRRLDWRAVRDLARLFRHEQIDLVQSHLYHANLYGRLAGLLAKVPVLATVHNTYTRPKLHRRLLNRFLAARSPAVIAVSDEIRRDLMRYDRVPQEKIVTVHNGIDVERVQPPLSRHAARKRLSIEDDMFAIGCVARLEEQKGHRDLIRALSMLMQREGGSRKPQLLLVGDGRLRAQLERDAAEHGVAHAVRFLGTRSDVPEILRALDVYAAASLWEGLSLALLEAMAAGLPVVATDVGGVSAVLGEDQYGLRVRPGDPAALARALSELMHDAERRLLLGRRAVARVTGSFSVQATVARLGALYLEHVRPAALDT